jgi:hypothetical protein
MARVFSYANTMHPVTAVSVQVNNGSEWLDLCNLDGVSRVRSLSIKEVLGTGRISVICEIVDIDEYRVDLKSLDPSDSGSDYNTCGSSGADPLLGSYHEVKVLLAKNNSTGVLMFTGYVGQANINPSQSVSKKDFFTVEFVGEMQPLVDHWIVAEEAKVYQDTYLSIGIARDVLSQIELDFGHSPNIVIEDTDLHHYVKSYEISDTNIYGAIHRPVSSLGYNMVEKYSERVLFKSGSAEFTEGETITTGGGTTAKVISWVVTNGTWEAGDARGLLYVKDSSGSFVIDESITGGSTGVAVANSAGVEAFRIAISDPDRTNVTPDINLSQNVSLFRNTYSEANVRTWVQVVYKDRFSGKEASVIASSDAARETYGIPDGYGGKIHKKIRIVEKDGSWIDTRAEAQLEAEYALSDTSKPWPEAEVNIPWLVLGVELGDLVRFSTDTETNIDICVSDISWNVDHANVYGKTVLRGTLSGRAGNTGYWYMQGRDDFTGQIIKNTKDQKGPAPITPTNLETESVFGQMSDGSLSPVLHARWHGTRDWSMTSYRLDTRLCNEFSSGSITGGNDLVLIDNTAEWVPYILIGKYVYVTTSTRSDTNQVRRIIWNDETSLRVGSSFDTSLTNEEEYVILSPETGWTYSYVDRRPAVQVEGLPGGKYIISRVITIPRGIRR